MMRDWFSAQRANLAGTSQLLDGELLFGVWHTGTLAHEPSWALVG